MQTDPTLLRYASVITELKKCRELLAQKFDRFQTLRNNSQQHATICKRMCKRTQHVTSNNFGSCWPTMIRSFARGFTLANVKCKISRQETITPEPASTLILPPGQSVFRLILTAAGLAQLVEGLTAERKVAGSIPGAGPILRVLK